MIGAMSREAADRELEKLTRQTRVMIAVLWASLPVVAGLLIWYFVRRLGE